MKKSPEQIKQQSAIFNKSYIESKFYQQKKRGILPLGLKIIYDYMNQSLKIRPEQKVLEVGCGNARLISLFECQRVGVDVSLQGITSAKLHTDGHFVQSNAETLPFANEVFDVVLCSEVLEHLVADEKTIEEIYRVLKPNGNLLITVAAAKLFPLSLPWFEQKIFGKLLIDLKAGHLRRYNLSDFQSLLRGNGFKILHSKYIIGFISSSGLRILIGRGEETKAQYTQGESVPIHLRLIYNFICLLIKIDHPLSFLGGDSIFILANKATN